MIARWSLALVVIMPAEAAAQLVQNGDFNQGPGFTTNVRAGSTAIPGWAIGGRSVDYNTSTYWVLPPGAAASIDLNGGDSDFADEPGSISQSFRTTPDQHYTVSFQRSANPTVSSERGCLAGANKRFEVTAGPFYHTFNWDLAARGNTVQDMKWQLTTFDFIARTSTTTLRFKSLNGGWCGATVTMIAVQQSKSSEIKRLLLDGLH